MRSARSRGTSSSRADAGGEDFCFLSNSARASPHRDRAERRYSAEEATRLMLAKWDAYDAPQPGDSSIKRPSSARHVKAFERWSPMWEQIRLAQMAMEAQADDEKSGPASSQKARSSTGTKRTSSEQDERRSAPLLSTSKAETRNAWPTTQQRSLDRSRHPATAAEPPVVPYERLAPVKARSKSTTR
ncbi:hypothetical protein JCM10908_002331 [Rhodotorula pacifica]|uniref:uncharacterized protein n=1 Tax=Rhodotorula pacifica TaxID=1495444 RepID=UPI0031720007